MKKHIVKIKLPYPIRVGFFSINRKIKVGFSFDNLAAFQFRENTNVGDDLKKWIAANGENRFNSENLYAAAQSYAMTNMIKLKINKSKFMLGIAQLSKMESKKIIDAWGHSTTFGTKQAPGKKKAVVNH